MKQRILSKWNWLRWVRLLIGLAAAAQGIIQREYVLSLAGLFLMYMAIADIGCCGSAGCAVDYRKREESSKEKMYEEVDS